jgi:hypothetical protein
LRDQLFTAQSRTDIYGHIHCIVRYKRFQTQDVLRHTHGMQTCEISILIQNIIFYKYEAQHVYSAENNLQSLKPKSMFTEMLHTTQYVLTSSDSVNMRYNWEILGN